MALRFRSRSHPQQTARRGDSTLFPVCDLGDPDESGDVRATPPDLFRSLDDRLGPFTLDAAAASHNAKCSRYFTAEVDGLVQPWADEIVWLNPPYSSIEPWVRKAWAEPAARIVMLLPANRTEQAWWQELVEPHRDNGGRLHTEFLRDRIRFIRSGTPGVGPNERPPFGCVLLIFERLRATALEAAPRSVAPPATREASACVGND